MGRKGSRLTVGDRILLHLINYTRYRGEMQAPIDVTQDGIARRLGIIRSAVPRAVGSLMDKDLVEEGLAHINGLTRRRKVYALTDEGIMRSRELWDSLSSEKVTLLEEGQKKDLNLGELREEGKVTLENISDVLTSGKLDLTKKKKRKEEKKKGKTSYVHSLNPPQIFLGREREISEIKEALKSNNRKITLIYGIAGVGKTTLAWKITEMFSSEMNIFYIDLKEWTSVNYVLKEMSNFLASSGWSGLKEYLDTNRDPDIESVSDLLKTIPEKIPLLMIMDDLHRAPDEMAMLLSSIKERIASMTNLNMIILSRARATFYDIRDVKISGLVGEMELLGFDRKTSRELLVKRGFKPDEVEAIIDQTGGHPLALVLVEREGYNMDIGDFDQFLKEEIFNNLSREETTVLGLLSLSRLQINEEDMRSYLELDPDALRELIDRHLVFLTPGGYVIHDLIKDQSVDSLNLEDKRKCHIRLASLFNEKLVKLGFHQEHTGIIPPYPFGVEEEGALGPVPLYVTEELHHLIEAGKNSDALSVMIEALLQIPSKDLLKEHKEKLFEGLPSSPADLMIAERDLVDSTWKLMNGDLEGSLELLDSISKMESDEDDEMLSSLKDCARLWKPFLVERVKGPKEAMDEIDRIDLGSVPERLHNYFQVTRASLRYKMGDYDGASEDYGRFLDSIIGNPDLPEKLRKSVSDAKEKAESGSIQVATDSFQKIMELTASNRDVLNEELPFVDVDHHLLSAIYSLHHGNR